MENEKKKILLVDDEKENVRTLKDFLEPRGYEILVAYNGREALKQAQKLPDLIILDVMMPGLNGIEVLQSLKRMPETCDTKVVMLSAKMVLDTIQQAREYGASDYLMKPVNLEQLLGVVKEFIG